MADKKIITTDIDGVLNNYPFCWLDFIKENEQRAFASIEEAKKGLGVERYKALKEKYRTSGYKSNIPINPMAPAFTKQLKDKGYQIIVTTSRPFESYPQLKQLTFDWLRANNITFDRLEKKSKELLTKFPSISFHVDDELDHVDFFLEKGIDVYLVRRKDINYTDYEKYKSLRFVENINDILSYIK